MTNEKDVEAPVTYSAGFLGLRFTHTDETSGEAVTVPGVYARIRCDSVDAYHAGEPGTVIIYQRHQGDPGSFVGSVDEVDRAMKRHWINAHVLEKDLKHE